MYFLSVVLFFFVLLFSNVNAAQNIQQNNTETKEIAVKNQKFPLNNGTFIRNGWISAGRKNCGKYGQDEWACRKNEKDFGLDMFYWGVGCIRKEPRCSSGKAISVAAAHSNSQPNRFPENKGCVKQWIRWECRVSPITEEQDIQNLNSGKYNEWAEKLVNSENKLFNITR